MQIKRFEIANLHEASARIKRELGPDAIILSTKQISVNPPLIEVVAARDDKTDQAATPVSATLPRQGEQNDALSCIIKEIRELKSSVDVLMHKSPVQDCDHAELRQTLDTLLDNASAGYPAHLLDIYKRLTANGLSRAKSFGLIETIKKNYPSAARDSYEKSAAIAETLISQSLLKDNGTGKRIKAFIGPTGVGKTTTIAKLAAHYSLDKRMKIGLITTDTYRIAATEQLKVYGKIMDLPVRIASEKAAFLRSLTDFAEKDLILVDTPGRNQRDDQGLNQIKTIFNEDVESVLLLSPTANSEYLLDTANHLRMFNYDRIILTKIDECRHFGPLYDVLEEIAKPVSYVTTGQNVPSDIEKASPARLAQMILQNRLN